MTISHCLYFLTGGFGLFNFFNFLMEPFQGSQIPDDVRQPRNIPPNANILGKGK